MSVCESQLHKHVTRISFLKFIFLRVIVMTVYSIMWINIDRPVRYKHSSRPVRSSSKRNPRYRPCPSAAAFHNRVRRPYQAAYTAKEPYFWPHSHWSGFEWWRTSLLRVPHSRLRLLAYRRNIYIAFSYRPPLVPIDWWWSSWPGWWERVQTARLQRSAVPS